MQEPEDVCEVIIMILFQIYHAQGK